MTESEGKVNGVDSGIIYDTDIYDALNSYTHDVPFYLGLAREARGPVLELCCGTGRITLHLMRAGIDITGLDFTPSMLKAAKLKANKQGLPDIFIKGDMRELNMNKQFGLIFIPCNSLQNTYGLQDIEKVFSGVRKNMEPDGIFAFDIFNPSIEYMVKAGEIQKGKYKFTTATGKKVEIDESCRYDSAEQINRVTWTFRIDGGQPVPQKLDMRCFYPLETEALLKYNGFRILHRYGSYDKKPFTSESMKQIYVCRKA